MNEHWIVGPRRAWRLLHRLVIAIALSGAPPGAAAVEHFEGRMASGDAVALTLSGLAGAVTGTLRDDTYAYEVVADIDDRRLVGQAEQSDLGIRVGLDGELRDGGIDLEIRLSILGEEASERIWLVRAGSVANIPSDGSPRENATTSAPGERDPALVGHWVHEEIYNSGSGADFLGASSRRGLILRADGGVADGGSAVSLSGDGYLGRSSDGGSGVVPGVTWFSRGQHLWLHNAADGQTVDLGRYYAEPGRMMVTAENGRRMLFTRAR